MQDLMEQFFSSLASRDYYDAHEILEAYWYPKRFEKSDEVLIAKGFINASVAMELIKKGKRQKAPKVWATFEKYRVLITDEKLKEDAALVEHYYRKEMEVPFFEAMAFRHACKLFDSEKKIPHDQLRDILDVGRLSPSSFGMEQWKFIVVQDAVIKEGLQPLCWNQPQITTGSDVVVILAKVEAIKPETDYVHYMFSRRGLSEDQTGAYIDRYRTFLEAKSHEGLEEWSKRQCYIAAANMMTYAASIGIDSCPIEGFDQESVEQFLKVDTDEYRVALLIPFGYRANEQPEKQRLPFEDVVTFL
jgi:nitroreductase